MAVTTTSAGTGPITQTAKTPGDILMEQLLTSVTGPAVNSLLDISATASKTGQRPRTPALAPLPRPALTSRSLRWRLALLAETPSTRTSSIIS
jgi:hypothetical protein